MAVISKFYLLDAASPNTGTLPSNSPAAITGFAVTGNATGASTARDATDTPGVSNPDVESTITANADTNFQTWGHRRFVSRPLAAQAIPTGIWTFSYARTESNLNHNMSMTADAYAWRPSTGAQVGTSLGGISGTEPSSAGAEQAESRTGTWTGAPSILDGDVIVFDVYTQFTQGMATAYTEQFAYDGTTEASTTTCASFVSPPSALTLFTAVTHSLAVASRTSRNSLLRR